MLNKNKREIWYSISILVIPILGLFTFAFFYNQSKVKEAETLSDVSNGKSQIQDKIKTIDPKISALSAYVLDLNSGQSVYAKNENKKYPLASLTKIMTGIVAFKNMPSDQIITIKNTDLLTEGESFLNLNERFVLSDLLDFMMLTSSNDAASAIASAVGKKQNFINEMNVTAKQIGLSDNTKFSNETGLDLDLKTSGAYGTSKDVALMMKYAFINYPELFENTPRNNYRIPSLNGFLHDAKNTNLGISKMPGLIASKTGYTDLAGGNLAVVVDIGLNEPYVIVVLGSTFDGRFDDIEEIINELKK